jgi:glycerate-2-kinase
MIIKDFDKVATDDLRRDILQIVEAGYEAISIPTLIGKTLSLKAGRLKIQDKEYNLDKYKNIFVVAIGKGSGLIAEELENLIGASNIKAGIAIDLKHRKLKKIKVFGGTHPLPSEKNIVATKKLIKTLKEAKAKDLVISVVCGGGSSLACLPASNNTCTNLRMVSEHMLKNGATIQELNTVRKHISSIHGGNMAKFAYPATVLGLIISDIPGNDLDIVASGPISKDKTTLSDAKKIASKFKLEQIKLNETPKDDRYFKKVSTIMLASGSTALEGMSIQAQKLGYKPSIFSDNLSGLAIEVGPRLAKSAKAGQALMACGETTVVVAKPGKGGRNQDVVLSALPYLQNDSVIVSAASDGKDNIDVAGGITDYSLAKNADLNPAQAVANNQSFKTLKSINGIYNIKKITANVSDFIVVLRKG